MAASDRAAPAAEECGALVDRVAMVVVVAGEGRGLPAGELAESAVEVDQLVLEEDLPGGVHVAVPADQEAPPVVDAVNDANAGHPGPAALRSSSRGQALRALRSAP